MSVFKQFRKFDDAPAEESADTSMCHASGCPCRASVSVGGGQWVCSFHAFAPPKRWVLIAAGLRDHDWFIGLLGDLSRQYMAGDKGNPWVQYASEFWAEQPEMLPTPDEQTHWPKYIDRLKADLSFRVGASTRKPEPWTHPGYGKAGNFREIVEHAE